MSKFTEFAKKLHSSQGRIVAGGAMVAALINGLAPDSSSAFDPGKAATIAMAVVVWLYSEIGGASSPSKHDIELHRRIKNTMNDEALTFLKDHDFGASLHDSKTYPVGEICSWHGADVEFRDPKIQMAWRSCQEHLSVLDRFYAQHLGLASRNDRLSVIPPGTDEWNTPTYLLEAVSALNDAASEGYRSFNAFDKLARSRLNL